MEASEQTATGTVKWFNAAKGYGFAIPDGGGVDHFIHYTAIQKPGYRTLAEGQRVRFRVAETPKGWQAWDVTEIEA